MNEYSMGQEFSFTFAMDTAEMPVYNVYAETGRISGGTCSERDPESLKGFYVAKGAISVGLGYVPGGRYEVFAKGDGGSMLVGTFEVASGSVARLMDIADVNVVSVATGAIGPWAMASGAIAVGVLASGAIDALSIADYAIDSRSIATGAFTDAAFATGAISDIALSATAVDKIMGEEVESASASEATVRSALKAGYAQGFGRWTIEGNLLTLYGPNGSTVYRQFELDSPINPTMRSPI